MLVVEVGESGAILLSVEQLPAKECHSASKTYLSSAALILKIEVGVNAVRALVPT